jgi:hypothetical protein
MSAFNADGKVVGVADQVTIMGTCSVIAGTGPTATITVVSQYGDTFNAQANDMASPVGTVGSPQMSFNDGNNFTVGTPVSVVGVVTAVSGSGQNAQLTVTLVTSRSSITVSAGAVRSTSKV